MRIVRPRPLARRPRVTVVVPCYRYGRYLRGVVGSALDQPGVAVDVIIVDDASPDDSTKVAQALVAEDSRVTLIQHETNRGHIATYNDGLAAATGDYVVLLSADDLLAPGALARATALMEHVSSVSFVYGYSPDFEHDPPTIAHRHELWSVWSGRRWLARTCRSGRNLLNPPDVVMRRSVMDAIGGYDASLPHTADLLVWLQAAARGDVGRVNGPDQGYYRVHGENMHLTTFGSTLTDLVERRRAFDLFVEKDLAGHPDQARLRGLAYRALATDSLRWTVHAQDKAIPGARALAQEHLDLARELWPEVVRTSLWRRSGRRSHPRPGLVLDRLAFDVDWRLRHKLRSRLWRGFGT